MSWSPGVMWDASFLRSSEAVPILVPKLHAGTLLVAASVALCACGNDTAREGWMARGPLPGFPHPTGLQIFNDQPWDRLTGNGWNYLRRTSSKDDDIVADPSAPFSPRQVLRIIFTPDMRRDTEPSVHWIGLPEIKEVYTSWWIRLSPNWTSSPAGGGKMTFLHAAPNGQGQVYMALFNATAPHRVSVNTEWAPYGQKIWDPNVTTTHIVYNRWYRIQWYVKWDSSSGAGDGIVRWWIDDVLNGDHTNVTFPRDGLGFHQFEFAPTLQNAPPHEQYMYIGHTLIASVQ